MSAGGPRSPPGPAVRPLRRLGHDSARRRGKAIGGAGVSDASMRSVALHLREQEMSLRDLAKRLVITTGTNKGRHPSPATVMRRVSGGDGAAGSHQGIGPSSPQKAPVGPSSPAVARSTATAAPSSAGQAVAFLARSTTERHQRPDIAYRPVIGLSPSAVVVAWPETSRSAAVATFVQAAHDVATHHPAHMTGLA
jgi:hypothetical protein